MTAGHIPTMYDNDDTNGDDSTEYNYVVYDSAGNVEAEFETKKDAEREADYLRYEYDMRVTVEKEPMESGAGPISQDAIDAAADETAAYKFFNGPPEPTPQEESYNVRRWSLGNHSSGKTNEQSIEEMLAGLDENVDDDLAAVLQQAAGMVGGSAISGFECPVCGLNHGHSDTKHDIREAFNVTAAFADQMEFNPYCHCGVNELAMLLDFYGYINERVFTDDFSQVQDIPNNALQNAIDDVKSGRYVNCPEEVSRFIDRVLEIKAAANGAPIATETEETIAIIREAIEDRLA